MTLRNHHFRCRVRAHLTASILRQLATVLLLLLVLANCAPVYETGVTLNPPPARLTPAGLGFENELPLSAPKDYRINPGDVIGIKFPRRPAYSDSYLVGPDGRISPPLIGSLRAAAHTTNELRSRLTAQYQRLLAEVPPVSLRRYLMQVDDVLDIRFPYMSDLNSVVTVRADGRISLPLIGDMVAEGKTPSVLENELKQLYTGKISNPDLVVMLKETRFNRYWYRDAVRTMPDAGLTEVTVNITKTIPLLVYVGGEVPAPGNQTYVGGSTALRAIYSAGGPVPTADLRSVVLLRRGPDNAVIRLVANLAADVVGYGTGDVVLEPFDVVIVPRSNIAQVGDALDQYIYRTIRPLANSSVGFFFTKQVGIVRQETDTTVRNIPP